MTTSRRKFSHDCTYLTCTHLDATKGKMNGIIASKGKMNSMNADWEYLTLLCCKSPRVDSREWGGMELRRPLPNRYTSSFLLRINGSVQAHQHARSVGTYLWSTVGKVRLTCQADNTNIMGTINRTQEDDRARHLKI